MTLVDAGPLVALIHEDDEFHQLCKEVFAAMREPLATVWPVVTEALHLLRFSWRAQSALLEMLSTDAVKLMSLDQRDVARIKELMEKYRDLPMDLADAAIVRVAEREKIRQVFTLDRRDFQVYRPSRLGRFVILPS